MNAKYASALRPADWSARLVDYIEQVRHIDFVWGENDCALMASAWVEELIGHDPASDFRGRYTTEMGAIRALKRYGTGTLLSTFEGIVGPVCAPAQVRRGDIVGLVTEQGEALGICVGAMAATTGPTGFNLMRLLSAECGWKIGS